MIVFKLPFEKTIYTVEENTMNNSPIEFFGFNEKQRLSFNGSIVKSTSNEHLSTEDLAPLHEIETNLNQEQYLTIVEDVIQFIKNHQLQKLVFSRAKVLHGFKNIRLTESFHQLCEHYPNAFVYLFKKGNECWMGAFSELLGKYNHLTEVFETMSLAGTLPIAEEWTRKEIEEQQPVTEYIANILNEFGEVEQSNTYDHLSGKIKHLRTDFKTKIKPHGLNKVVQLLHPTPAVCGIPKNICKEAITNFEQYNRSLYAGYSKIHLDNTTFFFVNLRCAKFHQNQASIFVGGGITKDSNAKKEWHETELKSHAILDHLIIS